MSGEPIVKVYEELLEDRQVLRDAIGTINMLLGDGECTPDWQGIKTVADMALCTVPSIYDPRKPRYSWEFPKPANAGINQRCARCTQTGEMNMEHTESVNKAAGAPSALGVAHSANTLTVHGVFKGAHGLEGLVNAKDFWDQQPYGTRLYYGDGIADYLHRDVLRAAIRALTPNV